MPIVGAHVSAAGGLWNAVTNGVAIGVEAIQIFGSQPTTWRATSHKPEAYEKFRAARADANLAAVWLHSPYLPNLAADDDEQWQKSIDCVVNALTIAHTAGADGVVLHTGSHKGRGVEAVLERVADAIKRILDAAPGDCRLALENAAGQGGTIGKSWAELGAIVHEVKAARLAVCLDTCHAFAAGYNIADPAGLRAMLAELDSEVGLDRLAVIHANDSLMEFGSTRDRHQNIGDGFIGNEGFKVILAEPAFAELPMLLEVPGIDGKSGPDAENVARLKRLRDEAGA